MRPLTLPPSNTLRPLPHAEMEIRCELACRYGRGLSGRWRIPAKSLKKVTSGSQLVCWGRTIEVDKIGIGEDLPEPCDVRWSTYGVCIWQGVGVRAA